MRSEDFIRRYALAPGEINGQDCVQDLIKQMKRGLEGRGNIPMIPSYLSLETTAEPDVPCCILDAGGTNLRVARAVFDSSGRCHISNLVKSPMLGTEEELSFDDFYGKLAQYVHNTGCPERVGFCFSYNVELDRTLDGILNAWCKEVRAPEATGKPVGSSLRKAIGPKCRQVHVLNDSTAALLGAHSLHREITLGVILGTGINLCYSERCANIPKVPNDLKAASTIISTEVGEYAGIPKTIFDQAVIAASDDPALAQAEKQCAGAYLGELITRAWQQAAREGLLEAAFLQPFSLPQISDYLAGAASPIPDSPDAKQIARTMIHRAAKIAAILTAGTILLAHAPGQFCTMVIEGSQFRKLTHFGDCYQNELNALLTPHKIGFRILQTENSCLVGAALAVFAQPM